MTVHYKTRGFVFKKEDRLDADRVFSVFTRDFGKVDVFGKAIRKINSKLRGGMEIFYVCDIEFIQGKSKKTLTDALAVKKFRGISENPEKFELAKNVAKLVIDSIHGQEKDVRILDLLVETFSLLEAEEPRQLLYYYFFWNFVSLLGYAPPLAEFPVDAATVIRVILRKDWQTLQAMSIALSTQQSIKSISYQHQIFHLPQA